MANRNGGSAVRVLVVAASAVRRAGLDTLIKNNPDLRLVASLQGSRPDLPQTRQLSPDVLLIDLERAFSWTAPAPANNPATIVLIDDPSADCLRKLCDVVSSRFCRGMLHLRIFSMPFDLLR